MNSKNSKTSDPDRPLLNLREKLKRSDKYVTLSILAYTIHEKILKSHVKTNLKYQLQHELKNLK